VTKTRNEAAAAPAMSDAKKLALHGARVGRLLDDHFDVPTGRYEAGWSDAKIAEETGLSAQFVAEIREAHCGPLRGDPEVDALKSEVATIKAMLNEVEARLAKAETRLAS